MFLGVSVPYRRHFCRPYGLNLDTLNLAKEITCAQSSIHLSGRIGSAKGLRNADAGVLWFDPNQDLREF